MKYAKSPIFYMGNKHDLLDLLYSYFPKKEEVKTFIDLFGGSGVVSINSKYDKIIYNELNESIYNLFKMLNQTDLEDLFRHFDNRIKQFNLPKSSTDIRRKIKNIEQTRKKYQQNYLNFRSYYNSQKEKDYKDLYLLTFYSFSNLIRFNAKKDFNMPFGNRFFTKDHKYILHNFKNCIKNKKVEFIQKDAFKVLKSINENKNQFVYLDPPYSNTLAIYNEARANGGWTVKIDLELFKELDRLNKIGVKWALSNVLQHRGKYNNHLKKWAEKNNYKIISFSNKDYCSLGKGTAKTQEVLIINYEPPFETYNIFDYLE